MMKVGFIGLGSQGGPMAEAIHQAGFDITIWARRAEVRRGYRERGVPVADSPADLAGACELVCLCVTGDNDVFDLVEGRGLLDAMRPGSTLAIHSTVSPATCERVAELAALQGVSVVDAPVSGSGDAVRAGQLLVFVGGEVSAVDRVRPVLGTYGNPVIQFGAVGDGQRAKILNNLACIANMAIADLALRIGRSAGLERTELRRALLAGSGRSFALDALDRLVQPESAGHVAALFAKDMRLAEELAAQEDSSIEGVRDLANRFFTELHRMQSDGE